MSASYIPVLVVIEPAGRISPLDVTLRVGCHLVYEVTGTSTLLLNVQPLRDRQHMIIAESLSLGDLPVEEYVDSHGNHVYRSVLRHGTNVIHHDAIVAVSSRADNEGVINTMPTAVDELPPELLRYTLPSRYCDSDRLTNFAWEKFGHIEHGLPRVYAISEWLHNNIKYTYQSGRPDLSAGDVLPCDCPESHLQLTCPLRYRTFAGYRISRSCRTHGFSRLCRGVLG